MWRTTWSSSSTACWMRSATSGTGPANRAALNAHATVVYLHTHPDDLARRLSRDTQRPLLQVADPRQRLRDLYAVRDPIYREVADIVVDTARKSAATLVNLISMQLDMSGGAREDAK